MQTQNQYHCLITGAASGIGKAIANELSRDHRCLLVDQDHEFLQRVAQDFGCEWMVADLSSKDDCKAVVDHALKMFGKVDVLINSAGLQIMNPIETYKEDDWQRLLDVMLTAPFLLTKYVWPSMKMHSFGRIIHLNSIHGLVASEYKVAYVSAKHGLSGLTKASALEGGPYGITVNSICPAYVDTPLVQGQVKAQAKLHQLSESEVLEKIMLQKAAIKKLIHVDDIAAMVKFLISDSSKMINGSCLTIDGAWTIN